MLSLLIIGLFILLLLIFLSKLCISLILLTPLDILPLPSNEYANFDGKKKADSIKELHRANIEKKNEQYAKHTNKVRVKVIFEPGDWICVQMRKERFSAQRKSKLQPRGWAFSSSRKDT